MERKIIPQGTERNRSYTVTLPMPWIKSNTLDRSLKVNLEVVNNRIVISAAKLAESRVSIDTAGIGFIIQKLIAEKYKLGVSEIEIAFDDIKTMDLIRDVVEKELIGFEILEQAKGKCLIADISKEVIEDFDKALRRAFHLVAGIADETAELLSKGDLEYANVVIKKDKDLNKLAYYCERQLNKRGQEYFGKIQFYFFLLERIENIGDMYKGICAFFLESKSSPGEPTLKLIGRLSRKLNEFSELFYSEKADYGMIKNFFEELRRVRTDVLALYQGKRRDAKYLYYIGGLFQLINGMTRALYSVKELRGAASHTSFGNR